MSEQRKWRGCIVGFGRIYVSRTLAVAVIAVAGLAFPTVAGASLSELTQKAGTAGCISFNGNGGDCAVAPAILDPASVVVSPDGASAYVASTTRDAVVIFDRAADGTLTQKPGTEGCISNDGSGGSCADGKALDGAISVAVSSNGASVIRRVGER